MRAAASGGRSRVAGLILAAGSSRRLGRPKQLLPLGGSPILQHVIDRCADADLDEIVVIVGHQADEVGAALRLPPQARLVLNAEHASGQASSLIAGVDALGDGIGAALILLGDQPEVRLDAIAAVRQHAEASPAPIVRAAYAGTPGHPVLLRRDLWPALRELAGDAGLRTLLADHPELGAVVEVGGGVPPDVDTDADYADLVARFGQ